MEKMVFVNPVELVTVQIIIDVRHSLSKNMVLRRHYCIMFLPIPESSNCLSDWLLTLLKYCIRLDGHDYNNHVTMNDVMHV